MKPIFRLSSAHFFSSIQEPVAKSTENSGNKRTLQSASPPDFQFENKRPRRDYFPPLRTWPNAMSEQSSGKLQSAKEQAKECMTQSENDASHSEKEQPLRQESNVAWELSTGPVLIKRELSLQQLKLTRADIGNGSFGSVSIFENENGNQLIGKTLVQIGKGTATIDLADELKAYRTIYDSVGPHPNLVHLYGIAQVPHEQEAKRTLLMDFIPGPTGMKAFDALRKCWDTGKISSEQYWGAIQFIARRLLDVTEHLGKAGVVHNDIKPENFLVNQETGEPVLIDLGFSSEKDAVFVGHTPVYVAPEVGHFEGVDERSDVFTVGASLLAGIEKKRRGNEFPPNEGLYQNKDSTNREEKLVRKPGSYSAKTAYTEFMNSVMEQHKDRRADSEKAKNLDFLHHSMLDDDAAKEVIKKAISLDSMEEPWKQAKPQLPSVSKKENWKQVTRLMNAARKDKPGLEDSAKLRNAGTDNVQSRRMRRLARYAKEQGNLNEPSQVEQDMKKAAMQLITSATWFDDAKRILETIPKTIKSGVDKDGRRILYGENKNIDPDYESAVKTARQSFSPYADMEDLRRYANEAEKFLLNAGTLKTPKDRETPRQIKEVWERAEVAKRMMMIFDADLSFKPAAGHVRDLVLKLRLEHQRKDRE